MKGTERVNQTRETVEKLISYLEAKKFTAGNARDWADELVERCTADTLHLYSNEVRFILGRSE